MVIVISSVELENTIEEICDMIFGDIWRYQLIVCISADIGKT